MRQVQRSGCYGVHDARCVALHVLAVARHFSTLFLLCSPPSLRPGLALAALAAPILASPSPGVPPQSLLGGPALAPGSTISPFVQTAQPANPWVVGPNSVSSYWGLSLADLQTASACPPSALASQQTLASESQNSLQPGAPARPSRACRAADAPLDSQQQLRLPGGRLRCVAALLLRRPRGFPVDPCGLTSLRRRTEETFTSSSLNISRWDPSSMSGAYGARGAGGVGGLVAGFAGYSPTQSSTFARTPEAQRRLASWQVPAAAQTPQSLLPWLRTGSRPTSP